MRTTNPGYHRMVALDGLIHDEKGREVYYRLKAEERVRARKFILDTATFSREEFAQAVKAMRHASPDANRVEHWQDLEDLLLMANDRAEVES